MVARLNKLARSCIGLSLARNVTSYNDGRYNKLQPISVPAVAVRLMQQALLVINRRKKCVGGSWVPGMYYLVFPIWILVG